MSLAYLYSGCSVITLERVIYSRFVGVSMEIKGISIP